MILEMKNRGRISKDPSSNTQYCGNKKKKRKKEMNQTKMYIFKINKFTFKVSLNKWKTLLTMKRMRFRRISPLLSINCYWRLGSS